IVCAKPSRYFGRLPWFAPWWNQRAKSSGSLAGSWPYFALFANSITVFGLRTPSRCSCNRTLGRLFNTPRSRFIQAPSFVVRRDPTTAGTIVAPLVGGTTGTLGVPPSVFL